MVKFICLFAALVALVSGANVICTDYGKDIGGGDSGYYEIPIPKTCTLNGWYPDYRIKGGSGGCKPGWLKHKERCYKKMPDNAPLRKAEANCNRHDAHIWVPSTVDEATWVARNSPLKPGGWTLTGIFCTRRFGDNPIYKENYTVTGEDTRQFEPRLRDMKLRGSMHPGDHKHKCVVINMADGNRPWASWVAGNCDEAAVQLCETPA